MAEEESTQEDEKSTQEGEEGKPEEKEHKPVAKRSELDLSEDTRLQAGSSARAITFEMSPNVAPKPDAPSEPSVDRKTGVSSAPGLTTAQRDKMRPAAFNAVFDKAREKLAAARDAMKDPGSSKALALQDARPTLTDAGSERDRWVLKDGRALDGIVYLVVPVGKSEWHASFGRECLNYATLARNTNKRQAIMPQYGDTVIAYVNTMVDGQTPPLVEIDPTNIGDVEAWVQVRVKEMQDAIDRRRAVLAAKKAPPTST
jgi:hypothetical protein